MVSTHHVNRIIQKVDKREEKIANHGKLVVPGVFSPYILRDVLLFPIFRGDVLYIQTIQNSDHRLLDNTTDLRSSIYGIIPKS